MMSGIFTKMRRLPIHYPLIRGMISYSIIWPTCSIVQEYLDHGATIEEANFARAARFGIFGSFFMAPVFYGWMKFSGRFFKSNTLKTAILRAAIEQVSYSPLAMAYFFFGMSLLELKPLHVCWNEVKEKFWPTYKIGVIFWPTAQTFNFYCVSEKNRVVFVSIASLIWTIYLAHMKAKEPKNLLLNQDINVLKMSETLPNYKVVLESDTQIKNQPLEGASADPNDSGKSKLKKKPETTLSVAPKDQVVSEADGNKGTISNPNILINDQVIPMATVPLVPPPIPDKILPATPTVDSDIASPKAEDPVQSKTDADNMTRNTIIIEPAIRTEIVSLGTPNSSESESENQHTLTVENNSKSDVIATDHYEQSIVTGLSENKADNLSIIPDIHIDTSLITPKVDAAFLVKQPGSGEEDKFNADELPVEHSKNTDPDVVKSLSEDVTIVNENSLVEIPIADEERRFFID